jgi:hypothetical protein
MILCSMSKVINECSVVASSFQLFRHFRSLNRAPALLSVSAIYDLMCETVKENVPCCVPETYIIKMFFSSICVL